MHGFVLYVQGLLLLCKIIVTLMRYIFTFEKHNRNPNHNNQNQQCRHFFLK
jgi:hypothetical protein